MARKNLLLIILLSILSLPQLKAQDDLMNMLGDEKPPVNYAFATFKTTRVILGTSVENVAAGDLQFLVEHNFGKVNEGISEFFGLDKSTIRLGLEYGLNDRITLGLGRSSYEKTIDGSIKGKILRQSSGSRNMPVTVSWYSNLMLDSRKWQNPDRKNYFSSRISYTHQLLIARKFSNALSLQLSPTVVHKNLVTKRTDPNDLFLLGAGGRVKVTERTSVNAEYFYQFNGNGDGLYHNSLSLGCDIETGGHVFQFRLTNAQPMFERAFLTETTGDWTKGDIYFGFTINRIFTIVKPRSFQK